ncbi:hypothetical protein niasHT_028245 [Heterodera trifolii]|uniref:Retrotransposon gag domain-containing protein n=1 Tax=Heterodera trifolii TaxID=157864 RepID=A0ABD2JU49_9BILA
MLWLIHQKRQLRNMDLDALRRRIVTLEREMRENGGTRSGLPMPTTFDGTTDLQDYLKSFNLIATAHNWTPARCVQVLPLFLRGSAKAIYESIEPDIKDNWRSLIDAMADKLKQMSPSLTARQKLAQRKQLTGESLEEFAQAIRNLVLRAYPNNSLEMDFGNLVLGALENDVKQANEVRLRQFRSEIARDFFRANMAPRLKERVMYMEEPQTLEEAVAQARRVEQVQGNLADDMWKNTQDAKAEVALAEVNAVRTEDKPRENGKIKTILGEEITPKDRTNKTFGEETTPKDKINLIFEGNPEFRPIRRGNFTSRGFTGYPRGLNTYRGGFTPRGANANFTPLGNNFQGTNNNGNFQPNFNQKQNWPRGRGPTGPNRGRGGSDADRGRTGWRVNEVSRMSRLNYVYARGKRTAFQFAVVKINQWSVSTSRPIKRTSAIPERIDKGLETVEQHQDDVVVRVEKMDVSSRACPTQELQRTAQPNGTPGIEQQPPNSQKRAPVNKRKKTAPQKQQKQLLTTENVSFEVAAAPNDVVVQQHQTETEMQRAPVNKRKKTAPQKLQQQLLNVAAVDDQTQQNNVQAAPEDLQNGVDQNKAEVNMHYAIIDTEEDNENVQQKKKKINTNAQLGTKTRCTATTRTGIVITNNHKQQQRDEIMWSQNFFYKR